MLGLMMDTQLTIPAILRRAAQVYPEKEVVGRLSDGSLTRTNYASLYDRVIRLMNALRELGVGPGDRFATFAWNSQRHLELYFAVPSLGAVLHTVNIRLFPDQVRYILQHAADQVIFFDRSLGNVLAPILPALPDLRYAVEMDDLSGEPVPGQIPSLNYETLIAAADTVERFPDLDERTASGLCYTSGTTGEPKGVLYSHRSTVLHAMGACMVDSLAIGERETVLPIVPMFHANAWGLPYACALTGAKQVFPGNHLFGSPLVELMAAEQVTLAAGVPTVWQLLSQYLKQHPHPLPSLHTVVCGGSAPPRSLIDSYQRDLGIRLLQAWGMTETSPVGSVGQLRNAMSEWPADQQLAMRAKQGIPPPGVELRIVDEQNRDLPHDGQQPGELLARGPWVAKAYYKEEEKRDSFTPDGWLRTGDIATIDPFGYVEITDRSKDMIKSRGEWISSVEMENLATDHPEVREAAVVARPDRARGEAPVLFVVAATPPPGTALVEEILAILAGRFAAWQLPKRADIRFIDVLPKTSVGKLDKKALRANALGAEGEER